jgi:hypothetical protein
MAGKEDHQKRRLRRRHPARKPWWIEQGRKDDIVCFVSNAMVIITVRRYACYA